MGAPSGEASSLLFALQAALGAGFIGYYLGVSTTRAKLRREADALLVPKLVGFTGIIDMRAEVETPYAGQPYWPPGADLTTAGADWDVQALGRLLVALLPKDKPLSKKFKMVGNGVPCVLASAVGSALREFLERRTSCTR